MAKKVTVDWKEKINSKDEDYITIEQPGRWGPYEIPAVKFHDIVRKGLSLLREHGRLNFANEKDISLEIRRGNDPPDKYIARIFLNDEHIVDIWCDRVTRFGDGSFCFYMNGVSIGGVYSEKLKLGPGLDDFKFK